jgi:signal transduction histidine kinase
MFNSARLKLTAWYLLIIMTISASFSAVIYGFLSNEIDRFVSTQRFRVERDLEMGTLPPGINISPLYDQQLINESHQRIIFLLFAVNGGILVLSGALSFFLAGRTLQPIQEMVDGQNRFISDASHELRTPLTALKSSMEVYLRDKDPQLSDARILIQDSLEDVDKLKSLSDSLLQLAQYQKPTVKTDMQQVSVKQVVEDAVRKISSLASLKNISLVADSQDVEIYGNKYGLIDLLLILLDNAIKYSPAGSKITVTAVRSRLGVTLSVKDQGAGIKKADQEHIFDRFFRSDVARSKTDSSGYGLGLSIAKKIVDLHRGTISVDSKVGKGTTFIVRLPAHSPARLFS